MGPNTHPNLDTRESVCVVLFHRPQLCFFRSCAPVTQTQTRGGVTYAPVDVPDAMATETDTVIDSGTRVADWQAGVAGGVVGGAVMAALIVAMSPPTIAAAIPALYGLSGGVAGITVHIAHGAALGVAFAAILRFAPIPEDSAAPVVGTGLVWGIVTWVVLAALVMPVWLGAVGFPKAPPVPNFAVPSLVWHVVYGGVLGVVYAALR
jgi:hypothetical protein